MAAETPDTKEAPVAIGAAMDSKLPQELDQQYIRQEMVKVIETGMRRVQAIGNYDEEKVVDELLALTLGGTRKLLFTRPELFDIFRRQQQILSTTPTGKDLKLG